jgi:hypothetical protein
LISVHSSSGFQEGDIAVVRVVGCNGAYWKVTVRCIGGLYWLGGALIFARLVKVALS